MPLPSLGSDAVNPAGDQPAHPSPRVRPAQSSADPHVQHFSVAPPRSCHPVSVRTRTGVEADYWTPFSRADGGQLSSAIGTPSHQPMASARGRGAQATVRRANVREIARTVLPSCRDRSTTRLVWPGSWPAMWRRRLLVATDSHWARWHMDDRAPGIRRNLQLPCRWLRGLSRGDGRRRCTCSPDLVERGSVRQRCGGRRRRVGEHDGTARVVVARNDPARCGKRHGG